MKGKMISAHTSRFVEKRSKVSEGTSNQCWNTATPSPLHVYTTLVNNVHTETVSSTAFYLLLWYRKTLASYRLVTMYPNSTDKHICVWYNIPHYANPCELSPFPSSDQYLSEHIHVHIKYASFVQFTFLCALQSNHSRHLFQMFFRPKIRRVLQSRRTSNIEFHFFLVRQ